MTDSPPQLRVILASASPRRRDLLTLVGVPHEVRPADIDEAYLPGEMPHAHAERLAREKAIVIAASAPDAVTIGSDTIVVIDGQVLGKPRDRVQAREMLRQLSGRTHEVMTGVAASWHGRTVSGVETVHVEFRTLADETIEAYIDTGEPMDKAGAYGIQGYGATIVSKVNGDYFAVMGLPLNRLMRQLESLGLRYGFGPLEAVRVASPGP
jgi:septum formation protein